MFFPSLSVRFIKEIVLRLYVLPIFKMDLILIYC